LKYPLTKPPKLAAQIRVEYLRPAVFGQRFVQTQSSFADSSTAHDKTAGAAVIDLGDRQPHVLLR
jgi:hypothetical protein